MPEFNQKIAKQLNKNISYLYEQQINKYCNRMEKDHKINK